MAKSKPFQRGQVVSLKIDDLAFGGKGLAKVATEQGDYIVFVPNVIAGQEVQLRITKARNRYAEGKLLRVLAASPAEQKHPYHPIPGAPYISLPLAEQESYKKRSTLELFRRIGKLSDPDKYFEEYIASPRSYHYRNKMEYSFSAVGCQHGESEFEDGFFLGFKKRGQWLAVEPLSGDSGLFDADLENALPEISNYFSERGFSAWHSRLHEGFCRMLAVRKSFSEGTLLVNLLTTSSEADRFDAGHFGKWLSEKLGGKMAGFIHTINDDPSDRPRSTDGKQYIILGRDYLSETILGLDFKIRMESFFQTNPASAEKLYSKALDYVFENHDHEKPVILDLFCGTGTIAQLLAQRAPQAQITGVDIVPEAIEDAERNAEKNALSNVDFVTADVGKFLLENPEYKGRIGTLTLDPPRAGIAPKTLRKLIRLEAPRIVYISCNPATQARDMEILAEAGYRLRKYSLVDQFPHTAHIECVALFEKEENSL